MARVVARGFHTAAVAAVLLSCVLPWGTVSEGNGARVRHGWDFPYADQVVLIDKVWVPMLAAGVLLVIAGRRMSARPAGGPGPSGPRTTVLESLAGPILAAAVSGFVLVDSLGVVDALMPGRARVRYRTDVVSLAPGPWVALAGAILGAASVLFLRGRRWNEAKR